MKPYTVIYVIPRESTELWQFLECSADDTDHAEEQCMNAYPKAYVLWVNEGHGEKSRTMENENGLYV